MEIMPISARLLLGRGAQLRASVIIMQRIANSTGNFLASMQHESGNNRGRRDLLGKHFSTAFIYHIRKRFDYESDTRNVALSDMVIIHLLHFRNRAMKKTPKVEENDKEVEVPQSTNE